MKNIKIEFIAGILLVLALLADCNPTIINEEKEATIYAEKMNERLENLSTRYEELLCESLSKDTNLVEEQENPPGQDLLQEFWDFQQEIRYKNEEFHWTSFENAILKRQFELVSSRFYFSALPYERYKNFANEIIKLVHLFKTVTIYMEFNDSSSESENESLQSENSFLDKSELEMKNLKMDEKLEDEKPVYGNAPTLLQPIEVISTENNENSKRDLEDEELEPRNSSPHKNTAEMVKQEKDENVKKISNEEDVSEKSAQSREETERLVLKLGDVMEQICNAINEFSSILEGALIELTCKFSNQNSNSSDSNGHIAIVNYVVLLTPLEESGSNEEMLKDIWVQWTKTMGTQVAPIFNNYVSLFQETAKSNDFKDPAEMLLTMNELDGNLLEEINHIWANSLKQHYVHLHTVVKSDLRKVYPHVEFTNGLIPEHIHFNLLATAKDVLNPSHQVLLSTIISRSVARDYTLSKMSKLAEEFYMSLGFPELPEEFMSSLERLDNSLEVTDLSSFKFNRIFRQFELLKVLSSLNHFHNVEIFSNVFSEIGKLYGIMLTQELPFILQINPDASTAGLTHKVVFDTMGLAANSVSFFKTLNLISPEEAAHEDAVFTYLLRQFFYVFSQFPASLFLENWNFDVLRGKIDEKDLNNEYWRRKMEIQGIKHPTEPEEGDFDAAIQSGQHITDMSFPLRRFVSSILKFQIFEILCIKADQFDPENPESKPLHECIFRDNQEVGKLLMSVLKIGDSKPWKEILKEITGKSDLDVQPMMHYFAPVLKYLNEFYESTPESKDWTVIRKSRIDEESLD